MPEATVLVTRGRIGRSGHKFGELGCSCRRGENVKIAVLEEGGDHIMRCSLHDSGLLLGFGQAIGWRQRSPHSEYNFLVFAQRKISATLQQREWQEKKFKFLP